MRYIHLHSQDIYNFLSNNDLLHRRIKFICIKSEGLKYIFCKQTQNVTVNENSTITVLNGYNCEVSNLLTKPACMSEEDYMLVPNSYKGTVYNIYYTNIYKVKIKYVEPNNPSEFITWIDNNRIVKIETEIYNIDQINDINFYQFSDVFVAVE